MRARHKFSAKSCTSDNIKFPSKLEKRVYERLKFLKQAGEVVGFLRQVPLHFNSGIKHVADFLVFFSDGSCQIWEAKGIETKEFKLKYKLIEEEYPWLDYVLIKK